MRHATSVATLRSRPSMLDAMFSGAISSGDGSGMFHGSVFEHVHAYLRDGVMAAGCEHNVSMLQRVKREFMFLFGGCEDSTCAGSRDS